MGGLDWQVKELMRHLLDMNSLENYVGIDVRMRKDYTTPTITVYADDEHLPENTDDDEISRLEEKLRILKEIERIERVLRKFREEHPEYVPVEIPIPNTPWPGPWVNPWAKPYIVWEDNNAAGKRFW